MTVTMRSAETRQLKTRATRRTAMKIVTPILEKERLLTLKAMTVTMRSAETRRKSRNLLPKKLQLATFDTTILFMWLAGASLLRKHGLNLKVCNSRVREQLC